MSAQNFDYFDTEREVYWGINKNSWGGLFGGGVLKFSNKISVETVLKRAFALMGLRLATEKGKEPTKIIVTPPQKYSQILNKPFKCLSYATSIKPP